MRSSAILTICMLVIVPCLTRAAMVRTLDGKTIYGEPRLDSAGALTIKPRAGEAIKVGIGDLLAMDMRAAEAVNPGKDQPVDAQLADPKNWTRTDVGRTQILGSATFTGRQVSILAAGMGIGYPESSKQEDFYFMHRPLKGDGQIVARIVSLNHDGQSIRVGVMFRESADPASPAAVACVSANNGYLFSRNKSGEQMQQRNQRGDYPKPTWLKLTRSGNKFKALISGDGTRWDGFGETDLPMSPDALVGLVVASKEPAKACTAVFDSVSVMAGRVETAETSIPVFERGIVTRSGSWIAGDFRLANETAVRFSAWGQADRSLPAGEVARIQLRRLTPQLAENIQPGRAGVLMPSGDFFEGELREMRDGRCVINSIVFGLKVFDMWRDVAAVMLHDIAAAPAEFEMRMRDGSVFLGKNLVGKDDNFTFDERSLGPIRAHISQIDHIMAGSARFCSLLDLKCMQATGEADSREPMFSSDPQFGEARMRLMGDSHARAIGVVAGGILSYELGGQYRSFICRVGVPDVVLPAARVRFVVLGDDKELFRTPTRTSLEEPLTLAVNMGGIKRLTLKVEPADAKQLPIWALWVDPMLVRKTEPISAP